MPDEGKILLADDELNFRRATAELLRERGYRCDVVSNADDAAERLRTTRYDVLIADIKMPGNIRLELIDKLAEQVQGLSIILVTGYPSAETAIASVQLPVLAYIVKPFKFEELLAHVQFGVRRSRSYQAIEQLRHRVQEWNHELAESARVMAHTTSPMFTDPLSVFLETSFRHIIMMLGELRTMTLMLARHEEASQTLAFKDPRFSFVKKALVETIAVLEKTKHAFKSKDLGALRKRLETLMAEVEATTP